MRRLKQLVTGQDMFGHPVTLNFNKKGDHHKTIFGGVASICLKVFLLSFLITKTVHLFDRRASQTF